MVKTLKNLLLQKHESFESNVWYIASGTAGLQGLFNDDLMLIFDRFTAMPNLRPYAFVWEKY